MVIILSTRWFNCSAWLRFVFFPFASFSCIHSLSLTISNIFSHSLLLPTHLLYPISTFHTSHILYEKKKKKTWYILFIAVTLALRWVSSTCHRFNKHSLDEFQHSVLHNLSSLLFDTSMLMIDKYTLLSTDCQIGIPGHLFMSCQYFKLNIYSSSCCNTII